MQPGVVPAGMPPQELVQWLRTNEIAGGDHPVLYVGNLPGESRLVVGQLCDRWFWSAVAILTAQPQCIRSLFQSTGQEEQGRYCVRIFKEANWINVSVDNCLPCNVAGRALFGRGEEAHEIWPMIVEKAFAKLHGCYENLMHG
ncbi:unnamed protein product [Choristocarpus tenellus]